MSPAENTPNFDAMSPEEIMAWMESLAKRQGANEGFTTSADIEIAEVDPTSVEIDEPGYVPYGKDPKKWAEEEAARKAAKAAQQPAPSVAAPPQPVRPAVPAPSQPPAPAQPLRPAAQAPTPAPAQPLRPAAQAPVPPPTPATPDIPLGQSTMSWLESLAADQGGDLPELDLSALAADITPAVPAPAAEPAVNPMDWLESLTQGQEEDPIPAAPEEVADPFVNGVDPMSWLESIARRQGGKSEELTTEANLSVPEPEDISQIEGPGYTPYSFDTIGLGTKLPEENQQADTRTPEIEAEPAALEDPSAWLDSLASSQGFAPEAARSAAAKSEGPMSDDDIQAALVRGEEVPHDQMERWMSRQLEIGAMREEPEAEYDPDAPAVPAELPDWLIEQVGASKPPEDVVKPQTPERPPLIDLITEPPPAADMPDWLKDEEPAQSDLEDIFATTQEETAPAITLPVEPEVVAQDTWAEALEYERQQDISKLPDWYVQNISDPARRAAVDRRLTGETAEEAEPLEDAVLEPETELPAGQPEEVPDWLQGVVSEVESPEITLVEDMPEWLQPAASTPVEEVPAEVVIEPASDIPDWLKSVDIDEVPDWLKETISPPAATVAPPAPVILPPAPVVPPQPVVSQPIVPPAPVTPPARPVVPAPAPQPVAARAEVSATLNDARASIGGGDIDTGLRHYESLVRANVDLDAVSADLTALAEKQKSNPAVFRVLGDSLMRQGKLQAALDTYRKALNQL